VAYQLELPPSWKIHNVFHASYLSPYKETVEHGPNFINPPPDIIEGQPEWEVEKVIGMRFFGQKREKQYHIHWKGYSSAHDTWEPEKNIHASELIAQYNSEQPVSIRTTRMEPTDNRMPSGHLPPVNSTHFVLGPVVLRNGYGNFLF